MQRLRTCIFLGVVGSTIVAAASPATADAAVSIAGLSFNPSTVTVGHGESVTWTMNDAGTQHTVTADGGEFDSGPLATKQTYTRSFPIAGSFAYQCNIHSTMHGTVQVRGAATSTTPTSSTTTTTLRATSSPSLVAGSSTAVSTPGGSTTTTFAAAPIALGASSTTTAPASGAKRSPPAKDPDSMLAMKAIATLLLLLLAGTTTAVATRPRPVRE